MLHYMVGYYVWAQMLAVAKVVWHWLFIWFLIFLGTQIMIVSFLVMIFTFLTNIALSFIIDSDYLKPRTGLGFRSNINFTFFQVAV